MLHKYLAGQISCQDFIRNFESEYYEGGAETTVPRKALPIIKSILEASALTVIDQTLRDKHPAYLSPLQLQEFIQSKLPFLEFKTN